jgi:hypothetical protein
MMVIFLPFYYLASPKQVPFRMTSLTNSHMSSPAGCTLCQLTHSCKVGVWRCPRRPPGIGGHTASERQSIVCLSPAVPPQEASSWAQLQDTQCVWVHKQADQFGFILFVFQKAAGDTDVHHLKAGGSRTQTSDSANRFDTFHPGRAKGGECTWWTTCHPSAACRTQDPRPQNS